MKQVPHQASVEPVVTVFVGHVRQHPERLALAFGGTKLSYREVDARSRAIAAALLADHVAPGSRLGLCGGASADLYLAMLGVLRAGCSYVPLDISYPLERLRFLSNDARLDAVLASDSDGCQVAKELPAPSIYIGAEFQTDKRVELPAIALGDEAYVIYTSGSTGNPKGVSVTHGNVASLVQSIGEAHRFDENDVWTVAHSHAFDWSVLELWGAWTYGGCAVVVPLEILAQAEAFGGLLQDHKVTVVNLSPSAFRAAFTLGSMKSGCLEPLRYLIFSSERLNLPMLKPYFPLLAAHEVEVLNLYGITETTVASTTHVITADELEDGSLSPIGRALPGLEITIRDSGSEVEPETRGEIVIGGWGVSSGYIGHAESKDGRFVIEKENGDKAPSVVYYTGDLGRVRRDGVIFYEGRADRQIKVRGYRIEPAEIERVLEAHAGIDSAIVCAEQLGGNKSLLAYFTRAEGQERPSAGLLRAHLKQSLPPHEIPAAVIEIPEVPLTINGKIDYRALASNTRTRGDIGIPYRPAGNRTEAACVTILEECLGFAPIGVDDSMDALGLDSLTATEAAVHCQDAGLVLSWADFKPTATVCELARLGRERKAAAPARTPVPALEGPLAMTPAQRRMLDVGRSSSSEPGMTAQLNASMMFTVSAQVSDPLLGAAVRDVMARYDALRLAVHDSVAGTFRIRDPQDNELEEVSTACAAELPATVASLQESVEMRDERLFRPILIHLEDDGSRRLLMIGHRIAVDGYSIATVGRGIAQRVSGSQIDEDCPPYSEWASRLPGWRTDQLDASARYWQAQDWEAAGGETTRADEIIHGHTQVMEITVPPGVLAGMRERGRSAGWRSDEVITWCAASALSGLLGTNTALLAIQRHGRASLDDLDVQRTPGCFTIDCPLLLTIPGSRADGSLPPEVLMQMREAARHAFGYWWLRYYSPDEELRRSLASIPTATVMVNYRGRMLTHTSSAGEPVLHGLPETGVAEKGLGTAEIFRLKLHINDDKPSFVLGLRFSRRYVEPALAEAFLQETANEIERISRG